MELSEFLSRLTVLRSNANGESMCRCPAHDDKTASLSVAQGDKGIVLKCMAGCDTKSVLTALGLGLKDLFDDKEAGQGKPQAKDRVKTAAVKPSTAGGRPFKSYQEAYARLGSVDCVYQYRDEEDLLLFEVARIKTTDGKTFRQHHPVGTESLPFISGVKGIRSVIYRLREVRDAILANKPVFVVEGEKDADRLHGLGYVATTSAMGAEKWKTEHSDSLRGALVIILPDNDEPGHKHAKQVRDSLLGKAASVRIVDLKKGFDALPDKGDVSDLMDLLGETAGCKLLDELTAKAEEAAEAFTKSDLWQAVQLYAKVAGYCVDGGRICQATQDGPKPLGNFVALPRTVLTRDDGVNITKDMVIDGWSPDGRPLPQVQIKANQFNSMNWVAENWDFAATLMPGNTVKDRVRYAISEVGQASAQRVTEYSHSGWRKIDGQWAYLYQGGAIGAQDVTVDLGSGLSSYRLDGGGAAGFEEISRQDAAVATLLCGTRMAEHVAVPLMATIFLAPLREFLAQTGVTPGYALFLLGGTGTRKSTALALALSHFGNFNGKSLPASFNDTANFIRKKAFLLKDMPIVVDDYHPVTSLVERKKMESTAQSLARAFGDGAERGRMRSDLSLQESMPPRGVAIISGEDTPGVGESGMARFYVVNVSKTDIPVGDKLTAAQESARKGFLQKSMAGYIKWLLPRADELAGELHQDFLDNRATALELTRGQHGRSAESIAHMILGYESMLDYLKDCGVLDDENRERMLARAWQTLCDNSKKQTDEGRDDRPSKLFLASINELLISQGARVRDVKSSDEEFGGYKDMIGYKDETWYYLMPQVSYRAVARLCSDQGQAFPLTQKMLYKQMREDEMLTGDTMSGGASTRPKYIGGKCYRLLWIPRVLVDGPAGRPEQLEMGEFSQVDGEDNPF